MSRTTPLGRAGRGPQRSGGQGGSIDARGASRIARHARVSFHIYVAPGARRPARGLARVVSVGLAIDTR
jgi:hypothetical protein